MVRWIFAPVLFIGIFLSVQGFMFVENGTLFALGFVGTAIACVSGFCLYEGNSKSEARSEKAEAS